MVLRTLSRIVITHDIIIIIILVVVVIIIIIVDGRISRTIREAGIPMASPLCLMHHSAWVGFETGSTCWRSTRPLPCHAPPAWIARSRRMCSRRRFDFTRAVRWQGGAASALCFATFSGRATAAQGRSPVTVNGGTMRNLFPRKSRGLGGLVGCEKVWCGGQWPFLTQTWASWNHLNRISKSPRARHALHRGSGQVLRVLHASRLCRLPRPFRKACSVTCAK